jgi:hypothetical protein
MLKKEMVATALSSPVRALVTRPRRRSHPRGTLACVEAPALRASPAACLLAPTRLLTTAPRALVCCSPTGARQIGVAFKAMGESETGSVSSDLNAFGSTIDHLSQLGQEHAQEERHVFVEPIKDMARNLKELKDALQRRMEAYHMLLVSTCCCNNA